MKRKHTTRTTGFSVARLLLGIALSLCGLALAFGVLKNGSGRKDVAANDADKSDAALNRDIPVPDGEGNEASALSQMEQYWNDRLTYPTGQFNPEWVRQAALQHENMPIGLPEGVIPASSKLHQVNGQTLGLSTTGFTPLGPAPEHMTGCTGCFDYGTTEGRINDIVVDPTTTTNGSIVAYAASVGGGVWKTTNCCTAATNWTVTTDGPLISTISIDTLAIDPNDHNTIYAGTGDLNFGSFSMGSQGILKSTDAGASWTVIGADVFGPNYTQPAGVYPQYDAVGKVRVDPNNGNNVMAGTKKGLWLSNNGGATWTQCSMNSFTSQRQDITGLELTNMGGQTRVIAAVGTRGFATPVQPDLGNQGANGIYIATLPEYGCPTSFTNAARDDNGFVLGAVGTGGSPYASGTPLHAGSGNPYVNNTTGNQLSRIDIAVAPGNPNVIYAQAGSIAGNNNGGCGNGSGCQLGSWASTDGGNTWSFMSGSHGSSLANCTGAQGSGDYPQNWYDQGLAVDPNNPNRVFANTFETWLADRTASGWYDLTCGYNGSPVANHVTHVDHHAQVFVPGSSDIFMVGDDGGVHGTNNASTAATGTTRPTWFNMDTGFNTIEFYAGDISANFASSTAPAAVGGAQDNGPSSVTFSGTPTGAAQWQMGLGGDGFSGQVNSLGVPQTQAEGTITVSGTPTAGQTFQVGSQTFTFVASGGGSNGLVNISTSTTTQATNIVTSINNTIGNVAVASRSGSTVVVSAVQFGPGGNSIPFSTNATGIAANGTGTLGATQQGGLAGNGQPVFWEGNNSGGFSRCITNCTQPGASWTSKTGGWSADQQSFVLPVNLFHGGIPGGDECDANSGCGHIVGGSTRVWETITANTLGTVNPTFWYATTPATAACSGGTTPCLTKGTLGNRSYINQVKYSPKWQSVAIVGTNDGNVQIGFNLGTGLPNQGNWVDVTGGNSPLPNRPILGVALDPSAASPDAETGYAAVGGFNANSPSTPGHVFQVTCTPNAGAPCSSFTWANKSGNLPDIPVDSVIVNPNNSKQVFAGSDFGLYFTNDITQASPTWSRFEGLPHVMIWDMMVDRGSTTLSVWTRSRGAWVYPLSSGSIVSPAPSLLSVASRMTHGSNGTFDMPLAATTPATVEPRRNSAGNFSIVFTFDQAVTNASASSNIGSPSVSYSGNSVIVNVSGVADQHTLTVSLTNISGPNTAVTPSASASLRALQADTNQDGVVNGADAAQARNASGQVVTSANYKVDVNVDGLINVGDSIVTRNKSGNTVADAPPTAPTKLGATTTVTAANE